MDEMRTLSGQVLAEEMIEAMAREAEAGFEPTQLHPLPIRRAEESESGAYRVQFEVDLATFETLLKRARAEGRGVGEIARLALKQYLCAPPHLAQDEAHAAAGAE